MQILLILIKYPISVTNLFILSKNEYLRTLTDSIQGLNCEYLRRSFLIPNMKEFFFADKLSHQKIWLIFCLDSFALILIRNFFCYIINRLLSMQLNKATIKPPKLEEFFCTLCNKRYGSITAYRAHIKNKHPPSINSNDSESNIKKEEIYKPKIMIISNKQKEDRAMQNQAEDKLYAFLGDLGEKNTIVNQLNNQDSEQQDRMMGQANYLENNVIRTPFETEFEINKFLPKIETSDENLNRFFVNLSNQTRILNEKLASERDKWEFRDPLEISEIEDDQFSLINVSKLLLNYKKREIQLEYPQFSIYLLWLAKITKPIAWNQFYLLIGYALFNYRNFLQGSNKSQESLKMFLDQFCEKLTKQLIFLQGKFTILEEQKMIQLLHLYELWIKSFKLY